LVIIHSQWLMSGRPTTLLLSEMSSSQLSTKNTETEISISLTKAETKKHLKRQVLLNDQGWVINDSNNHNVIACEQVWQQIMNTPMIFNKQPIAAIQVKQKAKLNNVNDHRKNNLNNTVSDESIVNANVELTCRFVMTSGKYFIYQSINGQIKSSTNLNSI